MRTFFESRPIWPRLRLWVAAAAALMVLVNMVRWGGTARPGPLFVAGVAFMIGMLVLFGLIGYWLYLSPLPAGVSVQPTRATEIRRQVAMAVPLAGLLFLGGGIWDEAWHVRYGGFGDDFLWPPHFLIYSSLGMIALVALVGVVLLLRGGDMRARFRAEPLLGLTTLVTCLLLVSLPVDQLWHIIYGVDLTAWSLPHIWIAVGFSIVVTSAIALQLSFTPRTAWRGLSQMGFREWVIVAQLVCAVMVLLQVGISEWNNIQAIPRSLDEGNGFRDAFWARPEWLYPVVLTSIALYGGNLALHTLRRVGAATLVVAGVALIRTIVALVLTNFEGTELAVRSYWLVVPAAVALDLWYAARHRQAETLGTLVGGNVLATMALLAIDLPIIAQTMVYPRINAATLPWMIVLSLLTGLGAGWTGARFGGWLASHERLDTRTPLPARSRMIAAAASSLALVYALVVILTAQPPTA